MVNVKNLSVTALLCTGMIACGGEKKEAKKEAVKTNAAPETVAAPEGADAAVPEFLIVKVPVDANGIELNEGVESKSFASDSFASAEDTDMSFSQAQSVNVSNELDQDSSSQQWCNSTGYYWNTPWYPGKLLGRGLWWGRNPYVNYYGYGYSYNSYRRYNYGGCNYYVYRRGGGRYYR